MSGVWGGLGASVSNYGRGNLWGGRQRDGGEGMVGHSQRAMCERGAGTAGGPRAMSDHLANGERGAGTEGGVLRVRRCTRRWRARGETRGRCAAAAGTKGCKIGSKGIGGCMSL
jgi:hypothetical protein